MNNSETSTMSSFPDKTILVADIIKLMNLNDYVVIYEENYDKPIYKDLVREIVYDTKGICNWICYREVCLVGTSDNKTVIFIK